MIGDVCNTYIEEGKLNCKYISRDQYEFVGMLRVLESFGKFSHHARVDLNGNYLLGLLKKQSS